MPTTPLPPRRYAVTTLARSVLAQPSRQRLWAGRPMLVNPIAAAERRRLRTLSPGDRNQPGPGNYRRRLGGAKEAQQRGGCLRLLSVSGERAGEQGGQLDLGRKRADKAYPGDMYQFADLLKADLGLAARNDRRHRFAGRRSAYLPAFAC